MAAGPPPSASPVALGVLIPDFPRKAGNLVRNFREGRTRLVRAVATAV
jgi:hypothetical protein